MKKIFAFLLMAALLMAGLAACSTQNPALAGEWSLVSYGPASAPKPAAPGVDTSIVFDGDGQVHGNVGCNSFSGEYQAGKDKITFGAISSTEMACDEMRMSQESAVFSLLTGKVSYTVAGNTLTLLSTDGASAIILAKR